MSEKARYLFTASMDVDPDKEDLFNEVYDTEHVPLLSKVPGVIAVQRLVSQPFQVAMGGELRMSIRQVSLVTLQPMRSRAPMY